MQPSNSKLIVSVKYDQKGNVQVAGGTISLAKDFSENRRESMPVMAEVINGNGHLKDGTFILVHHNRFSENSPHHIEDNLYSLAYNSSIFARLDKDGNAIGLCGNIFVDHIYEDYPGGWVQIPSHVQLPNKFKYKVLRNGFGFKKGQLIFAYEFANYEIVYVWKGVEKRITKIIKSDIIGKYIQ